MKIETKIMGVDEVRAKLDERSLIGKPLAKMLWKAALYLEGLVKKETPVDTGVLRSSIRAKIDPSPAMPLWAKTYTMVKYASFVEKGTKPHWPPPGALARWAHLHHIPEFLVARAIARRGTKGAFMFKKALEQGKAKVASLLGNMAHEIKGNWEK